MAELLAFVRLTSNQRLFERPVSVAAAWRQVEGWLGCEAVWVPSPTPRRGAILARLLGATGVRAEHVPDAHLHLPCHHLTTQSSAMLEGRGVEGCCSTCPNTKTEQVIGRCASRWIHRGFLPRRETAARIAMASRIRPDHFPPLLVVIRSARPTPADVPLTGLSFRTGDRVDAGFPTQHAAFGTMWHTSECRSCRIGI